MLIHGYANTWRVSEPVLPALTDGVERAMERRRLRHGARVRQFARGWIALPER